jgi:hypothetical protein
MFTLELNQNPFLVAGATRMEAVLTVTADRDVRPAGHAIFGLILDVSGSMNGPVLEQAKHAAQKAIALLQPETELFVVAFSSNATLVHALSPASPQNKDAAMRAIARLEAEGTTAISHALARARGEVAKRVGARAHVVFLTDGKNSGESESELDAELALCEGKLQADCRGVGTDWEPEQLRKIADRLLGTAQIIPDASGLEKDFTESMTRALGRAVGNVRLRLALPRSGKAKLAFAKQMSPQILDLTALAMAVEPQTLDLPTGAWAAGESRDFHLGFEMAGGAQGDEMLLARPSIVSGSPEESSRGKPIIASWTQAGDERSALINSHVAHYTGQVKLATDIQQGIAARAQGDFEKATVFLGRALRAAQQSGNEQATLKLRELVAEQQDGTVKLRPNVAKAKVMDLDLASVVTARAPRKSGQP